MKAFIPNLISLLNLLMGCIGVVLASHNHLIEAGIFVALGIFFDFFDGLAARWLKVSSELGKQLDSLADVVTSGVVPGIVMFQLLNQQDTVLTVLNYPLNVEWYAYLGFLISLGSAYRLAKFNIDDRQTQNFIGLPTPANAILILSLPLILAYEDKAWLLELIESKIFLIVLTFLSVYILNMNLELFSLKFKSLAFSENQSAYILIVLSVILIVWLQFSAIPVIIILYIILSLFKKNTAKKP